MENSCSDGSSRHNDPFVSKPSEISLSEEALALRPLSHHPDEQNASHEFFGPFDDLGVGHFIPQGNAFFSAEPELKYVDVFLFCFLNG